MKWFIKTFVIFILCFLLCSSVPLWLTYHSMSNILKPQQEEPAPPKRSAILLDPACICSYDDSVSLEEGITTAYSLAELHDYFSEYQFYVLASNGSTPKTLRYSEINSRYPIEITRSNGYSIYRVEEGGYYYLFWNYTFEEDASDDVKSDRSLDDGESIDWGSVIVDPDPILFYSTYIPEAGTLGLIDFQHVNMNEHTAYDISQIDPFCEFWLYPTGKVHERWSFTYLGTNQIFRITYQYAIPEGKHIATRNDLGLKDMIIVDAEIVDRCDTPSFFATIFTFDLP